MDANKVSIFEKILNLLFILILGIALGMAWRIYQVEPAIQLQFEQLKKHRSLLNKDFLELEIRLGMLENRIGKVKRQH